MEQVEVLTKTAELEAVSMFACRRRTGNRRVEEDGSKSTGETTTILSRNRFAQLTKWIVAVNCSGHCSYSWIL